MTRYRTNADPRLQRARRAARPGRGGPVEGAQAMVAQLRAGATTRAQLEDLARRGDEAALLALGLKLGDLQVLDAIGRTKRGKLRKVTGRNGAAAVRAWYISHGYEAAAGNQWNGLRKGKFWIKFKSRVYEIYKGKPSAWFKSGSHGYVWKASTLAAEAQQRLESGGPGKAPTGPKPVEELREKRVKQHKKAESARSKKALKHLAVRASAVDLALKLTPEERRVILLDESVYDDFWHDVQAQAAGFEVGLEGVTVEAVDSQLSIHAPPIPEIRSAFYDRRKGDVPESFTWTDSQLGLPVTISKASGIPAVEVQIGNLGVDPFLGSLTAARMARSIGEERTGISGLVKTMKGNRGLVLSAKMFMMVSSSPRKGVGTSMLRAWCLLLRSYGVPIWVAQAVGEQGASFLNELERRREIRVLNRLDNGSWIVECERALEDPRQGFLFNGGRRGGW